jgi:hypothetical protein
MPKTYGYTRRFSIAAPTPLVKPAKANSSAMTANKSRDCRSITSFQSVSDISCLSTHKRHDGAKLEGEDEMGRRKMEKTCKILKRLG